VAANTFFTAAQAAQASLAALRYNLVLPRLVYRDLEGGFVQGAGQTVNVRNPISAGAARTYSQTERDAATPITLDTITESTVAVELDTQVYKAIKVTDEDLSFNISDFARQVLVPQVESVADGVEAPLVAEMQAVAVVAGIEFAADYSDVIATIAAARAELNDRKAPIAGRVLAVGSAVATALIQREELRDASQSQSTGTLREAAIGRIYGFDVVESFSLDPDEAVAFERHAFALVVRPPVAPAGAVRSASVSGDGLAMRWLQDYDPSFLQDRSIVSTFVGAETISATRALRIATAAV
jgi:hypothetical protein